MILIKTNGRTSRIGVTSAICRRQTVRRAASEICSLGHWRPTWKTSSEDFPFSQGQRVKCRIYQFESCSRHSEDGNALATESLGFTKHSETATWVRSQFIQQTIWIPLWIVKYYGQRARSNNSQVMIASQCDLLPKIPYRDVILFWIRNDITSTVLK